MIRLCAWCELPIVDGEDDVAHADRCRTAMFPEDAPDIVKAPKVR